MTKSRTSKYRTELLKSTVVAGGVIATLLGTNLLAQQDSVVEAAEVEPPSTEETSGFTVAKPVGIVSSWQPALAPIPTVAGTSQIAVSNTVFSTTSNIIGDSSTSNTVASAPALSALPKIELPPLPSVAVAPTAIASGVNTQNLGEVLNFQLNEIPSVQIPSPVTSSKSSK